jgi:hypothetical protein
MSIRFRAAATVLALAATTLAWSETAPVSAGAMSREWNFKVWLGDTAIGHHNFRLIEQAGERTLVTEADFKVRFLFVTAYRYLHFNTETWQGGCLQKIESRTDANGRILNVAGLRGPEGFELRSPAAPDPVPGCVKTFAYWDAGILDEDKLLNPQTGELMSITVERLAGEDLRVRGHDVPARKYRLLTKDLSLEIWYSDANEWLALESTTKDGRTLRYELI